VKSIIGGKLTGFAKLILVCILVTTNARASGIDPCLVPIEIKLIENPTEVSYPFVVRAVLSSLDQKTELLGSIAITPHLNGKKNYFRVVSKVSVPEAFKNKTSSFLATFHLMQEPPVVCFADPVKVEFKENTKVKTSDGESACLLVGAKSVEMKCYR